MRATEREIPNINKDKEDVSSFQVYKRKRAKISRIPSRRNSIYDLKQRYETNGTGRIMPIIVNVFSLSETPHTNTEELFAKNIHRENNHPEKPLGSPFNEYGQYERNSTSSSHRTTTGSINPIENIYALNYHQTSRFLEKTRKEFIEQCQESHRKKHRIECQQNVRTIQYRSGDEKNIDYLPHQEKYSSNRMRTGPIVYSSTHLTHTGKRVSAVENRKKSTEPVMTARRRYVLKRLIEHIQRNRNARSKA